MFAENKLKAKHVLVAQSFKLTEVTGWSTPGTNITKIPLDGVDDWEETTPGLGNVIWITNGLSSYEMMCSELALIVQTVRLAVLGISRTINISWLCWRRLDEMSTWAANYWRQLMNFTSIRFSKKAVLKIQAQLASKIKDAIYNATTGITLNLWYIDHDAAFCRMASECVSMTSQKYALLFEVYSTGYLQNDIFI